MGKTFLKYSLTSFLILIFSSFINGNNPHGEKDETLVSVVVIDPGHGGKDWGASIGNAKEKDIVLDIALKLGNRIKTKYPKIEIVYTRSKDIFIPLNQRANIANKNKADLFISIHVNAVEQKYVHGTETFVLGNHRSKDNLNVAKKENAVILLEENYNTTYEGFDPNSPESYIMFELVQDEYLDQSVMFATAIQKQIKELAQRSDRSVKQAGFLVLRQTTMPSVLIETGFLSNTSERNYLTSESGKTNLSSAIFSAFETYKNKIEENSSFNLVSKIPETISKEKSQKIIANKKDKPSKQKQDSPQTNIYFSVQIMALTKTLEINSKNFKGEENIFIIKSEKINRYYSGKYKTFEEAQSAQEKIQNKYKNAFIVAFENNTSISVKKAQGKM